MYSYKVRELTITSKRNSQIPVTVVLPDADKAAALVVFVHGFKAERTEGGRFLTVAEALALRGIYGIMMDQPGCGESQEGFSLYCTDNSLDDISSCVDYMLENYGIDDKHMAMVGYSNGGRNTAIYVTQRDRRFKTIVLWAAAIVDSDSFGKFMYDSINDTDLYQEALKHGTARYYNEFDDSYLDLSVDFFRGIFNYDPVEAMKEYDGNVLICHGSSDGTVDVQASRDCWESLSTEKESELLIIEGADHGFGLWDNHMEQSKILTDTTIEFLYRNI